MSSYHRNEDNSSSKNRWIEDTHEARRDAIAVRQEINAQYVRTKPFDVPEVVDIYNRMIHKYAAQLRPKFEHSAVDDQERVADSLWYEELCTVDVPPEKGRVQLGSANIFGEIDADEAIFKLNWDDKPVRIADLNWWKDAQTHVVAEYDVSGGVANQEHIWKTLFLPVYAADCVFDQLNRCLEDLGWLPEESAKDIHSEVLR